MTAPQALLGAILLIAAGWDIARRRIPNPLVFLGLAMGLGLGLVHEGSSGLQRSLFGVVCAFALTFPQWRMGWMGGGDAKLLMVVGAFLGARAAVDVLLWAMVANGIVSLGLALTRSTLARMGSVYPLDVRVPMAVAIAVGLPLALRIPLIPT